MYIMIERKIVKTAFSQRILINPAIFHWTLAYINPTKVVIFLNMLV